MLWGQRTKSQIGTFIVLSTRAGSVSVRSRTIVLLLKKGRKMNERPKKARKDVCVYLLGDPFVRPRKASWVDKKWMKWWRIMAMQLQLSFLWMVKVAVFPESNLPVPVTWPSKAVSRNPNPPNTLNHHTSAGTVKNSQDEYTNTYVYTFSCHFYWFLSNYFSRQHTNIWFCYVFRRRSNLWKVSFLSIYVHFLST